MDKKAIIKVLEDNDLGDIQQIDYKEEALVLRLFYDFDEASLDAAKAYANDESSDKEGSEEWQYEYFLPYLNDLAVDEVGEIMEEIMEDFSVDAQFVSYELDSEEYSYNEFIAAFFPKGKGVEIEQVLEELKL